MSIATSSWVRLGLYFGAAMVAITLLTSLPARREAAAQTADAPPGAAPQGAADTAPPPVKAPSPKKSAEIDILQLALAGGIFMIPICGMSILAVTMAVERFIGLRQSRVLPPGLIAGLGQLGGSQATFDPRKAYRLCQQYPSAASNIIRAMLLRVGRPLPEIESAVAQASQREADRLYANVKWLNLAASLSTMLGLIGTIQGMILAFHQLQGLEPDQDRTAVLANGIYTALVTTFAGLAVAIPSALFSHMFEGRIQGQFRQIEELTFHLMPQLERYEGRVRFSRQGVDGEALVDEKVHAAPAAAAAR